MVQRCDCCLIATECPVVGGNVGLPYRGLEAILTTEREPLPQREEAVRCASEENGRRCVLPPEHQGEHVYPPFTAA